jgi:hypothetical protein
MRRKAVLIFPVAIIVSTLFIIGSCATTDHRVRLAPLPSAAPVSASGLFTNAQGVVISSNEYYFVDHFQLEKTLLGPVGVPSYTTILDIGPDLLALIDQRQADAVVNFRVIPKSFYGGSTGLVGTLHVFGGFLLVCATVYGMLGIAAGSNTPDVPFFPLAIGCGAVGGGSLLLANVAQANSKTIWKIVIEGDLVRQW